MNRRQKELWNNLMHLVDTNEAFYFADQEFEGEWFRIFNYRLASYGDFLLPDALECRGHTFRITEEGYDAKPTCLASLAPEKFFNHYENPLTMDLDLNDVKEISDKADGSLITTYIFNDVVRVKTKGSLHSDQAVAANEYINRPENAEFLRELYVLEYLGYTVIMEWCAPDNRIVLPYEEAHLKILAVRNRDTFGYCNYQQFAKFDWDEIPARWVYIYDDVDDAEQFLKDIEQAQNIEGVVVRLNSGQRFKKKCEWYLALHHTKDTINSPRRLFEAVLEEASDDLRSLFHDDPMAIAQIEEMEKFVEEKYNHMVDTVERFYERNKDKERKDYAILGQEELPAMYFGLAMSRYVGREVDYKDFLKRQWKKLGLKDKEEVEE